jgi:hypothetical protein
MRALLNSLGLTLWSSIAIVLAVGLALVGYRVSLTIGNSPAAMSSPPTLGDGVEAAPAMSYGSATRPSRSAAAPSHGETVSRVIGPEMKAAQAAPQADYEAALAARKYTPDDLTFMAQIYYLQRHCDDTVAWADRALAASKQAGEAPKENAYQFKLQCASDAGNTAGMESPLVDLIKLTHKTTYWNTLLRLERQDERDDHNLLMIYRVMYNTGSMNADTDYIEMAQLLRDAALPGEAAAVVDKAMSSGIVKDEHKERTMRLLDALQGRADSDRKGLPQQAVESSESSVGDLDVKLGELYYGFEDYRQSVEAITRGLQKGLVTHKDDAYVYLGLAQLKLKNFTGAQRAFASLKNVSDVSSRTLKLWGLYADTLTGDAQIAEQFGLRQPRLGDRY